MYTFKPFTNEELFCIIVLGTLIQFLFLLLIIRVGQRPLLREKQKQTDILLAIAKKMEADVVFTNSDAPLEPKPGSYLQQLNEQVDEGIKKRQ